MKRIINYLSCVLAATAVNHAVNAQELKSPSEKYDPRGPLTVDSTVNQRMQKDLSNRNSLIGDQTVAWRKNGNGYNGTYSVNNTPYMARYDKDGKYVETLTKKEWNDDAPADLKSSFDQSYYKSQKVTGFWEVTDPARKGYYIELNDDMSQPTGIWANEKGRFSSSPSYVKSSPKRSKNMLVKDSTLDKNH